LTFLDPREEVEPDVVGPADWLERMPSPVVFAGPENFSSRAELLETAERISTTCRASLLLVDVWQVANRHTLEKKVDKSALRWLCDAREATGLPVACAVAAPPQVEQSVDAGLDALWIGARTTSDPGCVREIAAVLRGSGMPVMVKNPLNPDIGLWVSAFEALNQVGLTRLAAVHRGFSLFNGSDFRYEPRWDIAIELRTLAPQLPVFCDLSHVSGDASSARDVAQTAVDLDMRGLWVELCTDSMGVRCGSKPQMTAEVLQALLSGIQPRAASTDDEQFKTQIDLLRRMIDSLDRRLLETLSERQAAVDHIAECKQHEGVTILQLGRWREICHTRAEYGGTLGLDADMIQELFEVIHNYAIRRQGEKMKQRSAVDEPPPQTHD
jgi:chorismate mutase